MIEEYVREIRSAISNHLYYPALALALTLPDVCGNVEYPESSVFDRYTKWYDECVGLFLQEEAEKCGHGKPYLNGEMVYNLRNTFLHSGNPGVDSEKIKNVNNKPNKFILFVGDCRGMMEITLSAESVPFKAILVDITYLCNLLCDSALYYYQNKRNEFHFDYNVMTEADLFGEYS